MQRSAKHALMTVMAACALVLPEVSRSESVTLLASETVRLVNPTNSDDVRILCSFTLPSELMGVQVLDARVDIATVASEEVPVVAAVLGQSWGSETTWESAAATLGTDPGFLGTSSGRSIGSNLIELDGAQITGTHAEIQVAKAVAGWVSGGANFGLCVRGVDGALAGVSSVFGTGAGTPTLTVVYTKSN